jgi:Ca2+-binding EF-hand superfamily protein
MDEVGDVMKSLGREYSDEQLKILISKLDPDGIGSITFP